MNGLVAPAKRGARSLSARNLPSLTKVHASRAFSTSAGEKQRGALVLSNGAVYEGFHFGSNKPRDGHLVFSTNMTGYPESMTDPSYCSQAHHYNPAPRAPARLATARPSPPRAERAGGAGRSSTSRTRSSATTARRTRTTPTSGACASTSSRSRSG